MDLRVKPADDAEGREAPRGNVVTALACAVHAINRADRLDMIHCLSL
jgi:hypothetical protein